jgi:hypothetical protein
MFLITVVFPTFSAAAEGAAKPDRVTASKYHLTATGSGG